MVCTFNVCIVSRDPFFSLQPAALIKMVSLQEIFCKFSEIIQNSYHVKPKLNVASDANDISTLIIYSNYCLLICPSNHMFGRAVWDQLTECIFKILKNHDDDLSQKSPNQTCNY